MFCCFVKRAVSCQSSAFSLLLLDVCGLLFVMRDSNRKERYEGAKGAKFSIKQKYYRGHCGSKSALTIDYRN